MNRRIGTVILAALMLTAARSGYATPVLRTVNPIVIDYVFGVVNDFTVLTGTGLGDVTAPLWSVDLLIPSPGNSTSGCQAADFAGFPVGNIALIQRGTCLFQEKVANAQAAGAVGVLVFNEGNTPDRLDPIEGTLNPFSASVPVFFASFAIGNFLHGVATGPTGWAIQMKVAAEDLPAAVPEPGSITLLGLGLAGLARHRRRRRAQ